MLKKQYNIISAILAFLIWGGWSYFVNYSMVSAFCQGVFSFLITLIMIKAVDLLSRLFNGFFKIVLPTFIISCVTFCILYLMHSFIGTMNILITIMPPVLVGFFFCLFTSIKFNKNG
jgi:hypothetical protein